MARVSNPILHAELSVESLNKLAENLTLFDANFDKISNDIVQYLLDRGKEILAKNISSILNQKGDTSTGELLGSITTEIKQDAKGGTIGRLYVTSEHAKYREFGIGVIGSASGYPSDSPFKPDGYRTDMWVYYNDKDGKFYKTKGYTAGRFMYNTYKELMKIQGEAIEYAIRRNLKK